MNAHDPRREELYTIKGDVASDGLPAQGALSHMDLTSGKVARIPIRYKDRVTEADLYKMGDQLMLNLYCPKCENSIRITSDRKSIGYNASDNTVSVEPFECTWELGRSDATKNDRILFGAGLCRWRVGIVNNIAKDA